VSPEHKAPRASPALRLPLAFFGLTLILILAHQGRALELLYPLGAFGVGVVLYRRYPAHYVGFLCWLFFVSSEVRRLADFYNGAFNATSPIQLAPLMVAALSGFGLLRHHRLLAQRRSMPLLLVLLGVFYSYLIGMTSAGLFAATYSLVAWIFPVLIAFHVMITWESYPVYQRVLLKTFVWGGVVMGLYGIVQFTLMPPWDAFWLLATKMNSEGLPIPFGIRVSSTMNSSGPFAIVIMACTVFSSAAVGKTRMAAMGLSAISLLLTVVRAAWGGWVIALLYMFSSLNGRGRARMLLGVMLIIAFCAPLATIGPVADTIANRFSTITDIKDDNSYQVRSQFYAEFLSRALTDIAGQGMGSTGQGSKLSSDADDKSNVNFDSGLMEIPFVMGWPGTLMYGGGVIWMLLRALSRGRQLKTDKFASAACGVSIAIFAMMVFVNTLTGSGGLLFFLGVSFPVIAYRYDREIARPAAGD
jgi:hypothetical protein